MNRKTSGLFAGLLFVMAVGVRALIAQEPQVFNVPVPPPPQDADEDVMFWNDMDDDGGTNMEWFGTGPEMAAIPGPHFSAGRRVFFRGENRPWLGVVLTDIDSEKAKELKLASENGVLVKIVSEDSPAAKAGLMKDDVIVEFAGEKVRSAAQLSRLVRETPSGRSASLVVNRAGKTQTLTAKLETQHAGPMPMAGATLPPEDFTIPVPPMPPGAGRKFNVFIPRGARLGISGDDLTPQLAEFFGVKQGKGVLVREVIVGTAAEKAGLKAGDVIVAVDGQEVESVGKLRRALAEGKTEAEKRKATINIVRDKREQTLTVELDAADKIMTKPVMRTEFEFDTEGIREIADQVSAGAEDFRGLAKVMSKEWQLRLQEEVKRLHKELPKLQEEIQKEVHGAVAELERI